MLQGSQPEICEGDVFSGLCAGLEFPYVSQGSFFVRLPPSIVLGALVLAGCAGTPERPADEPARIAQAREDASHVGDPRRRRIVETALSMVGVPYVYGGESAQGFDCSGLVQFSYRSVGIILRVTPFISSDGMVGL